MKAYMSLLNQMQCPSLCVSSIDLIACKPCSSGCASLVVFLHNSVYECNMCIKTGAIAKMMFDVC